MLLFHTEKFQITDPHPKKNWVCGLPLKSPMCSITLPDIFFGDNRIKRMSKPSIASLKPAVNVTIKKYIIYVKKVRLILGDRVVFIETGACQVFSPFWFYQLKSAERHEEKHSIVCKTGMLGVGSVATRTLE